MSEHPIHASITLYRVMAAVERYRVTLDNPGFCLACGEEAEGCEPDAIGYECEACGEEQVMGAEELLIRLA
jgi:hypothetical protein